MNQSTGVDLLLVEDNADDARFVQRLLVEHRGSIDGDGSQLAVDTITHVDCLADGLDRVEADPPDIVLLDLGLPDSNGLETIEAMTERSRTVPVVVLTGQTELGVEAIRSGAQDYLVKGSITAALLLRTIRYAIERGRITGELRDRTHRLALVNELVRTGLRNDISMIVGWGDQLEGAVDEADKPAVDAILAASTHALDLVDTAAELMDVISGALAPDDDPHDLRALLAEEDDRFRQAHDAVLDIEWRVPDDEQLLVTGTPLLGSVFEHLLSSAVTHRDCNAVSLAVEANADCVSVSVVDDGVRLSEAERAIFTGSATEHEPTTATAVGFYFVTTVLEKVDGEIEVNETHPEQTVVTVQFDRR